MTDLQKPTHPEKLMFNAPGYKCRNNKNGTSREYWQVREDIRKLGYEITCVRLHFPNTNEGREALSKRCQRLTTESILWKNNGCKFPSNIVSKKQFEGTKNALVSEEDMIYFIKEKRIAGVSNVKIGFSNEPYVRLSQLQTSHPCELLLIAIMKGNKRKERELHKLFKEFHIRGEWFKLTKSIRDFIKENCDETALKNKGTNKYSMVMKFEKLSKDQSILRNLYRTGDKNVFRDGKGGFERRS